MGSEISIVMALDIYRKMIIQYLNRTRDVISNNKWAKRSTFEYNENKYKIKLEIQKSGVFF